MTMKKGIGVHRRARLVRLLKSAVPQCGCGGSACAPNNLICITFIASSDFTGGDPKRWGVLKSRRI